jgi:hypothetical protein
MSRRKRRRLLRFESKNEPLVSKQVYAKRLVWNAAAATMLILGSLGVGMLGYRWTESMEWIDAFANATMILSGMGPLNPPQTYGGKLFAGVFALYSGLALLVASAIILAPVLHRMLHHFQIDCNPGS